MADALSALISEVGVTTPPDRDEVVELSKRARGGDESAVAEIVRRNMPMVIKIAKGCVRRNGDMIELVQVGAIALWKCAKDYDWTRGTSFSTFAWIAVQRAIWQSTRKRKRDGAFESVDSLDAFVGRFSAKDAAGESIAAAVADLPEYDRYVIERRFGLDGDYRQSTLAQLGEELGVSREQVRLIQVRALGRLKERLADLV
jgi:RNA polymerase sigma factor (sigma-70 family)